MRLDTKEDGDQLIWTLSGSFSFASYNLFGDAISRLPDSPADRLLVDVSKVTFVDSAAAWMLLCMAEEADRHGRQFAITGAQGEILQALQLAQQSDIQSSPDEIGGDGAPQDVVMVCEQPPCPQLQENCGRQGIVLAEQGTTQDGSAHLLYGAASSESIAAGLSMPLAGFVEACGDHLANLHPRALKAVRRGGFILSLSTRSACRIELSLQLEHAILQRFPLGRREGDDMVALCLAEAISNAVIHGNLDIASEMRGSREGFRQFRQIMNDRLTDPALAERRVTISLSPIKGSSFMVSISDEGNGFDIARHLGKAIDPAAKFGRGLALIRKVCRNVWAEDDGRTLIMTF